MSVKPRYVDLDNFEMRGFRGMVRRYGKDFEEVAMRLFWENFNLRRRNKLLKSILSPEQRSEYDRLKKQLIQENDQEVPSPVVIDPWANGPKKPTAKQTS